MNKKQKSLTNKGFSLVELIIVIAIMAVLVGVLAPQYLKYVRNSKISTDVTNAQEMATAINVAISDGKTVFDDAGTAVTWANTSASGEAVSKLGGTWSFKGSNTNGVESITLTITGDDAGTYQCYPNPDQAAETGKVTGLNTIKK